MSQLEPLAPDQRAVVALVLQQGRSYDEIAGLLGIPVDAVRARAQAGLSSLAPGNGLPGEITGTLADYLLGQQAGADAEATRGLLAESEPARAWASHVAQSLSGIAPGPLPEIPGAAAPPNGRDAPPAPRPRPVREAAAGAPAAPPASSRLGGVLLIAAVLAVVGLVLFLVLRGGDDDPGDEQVASGGAPAATATPTPTPTASATPRVADRIALQPTGGGRAKGTMTVFLQGDQLLFALEGQRLPPSGENAAYAVWLTGPGDKARRLGFTDPVGADGKLGIQGPSEKDLAAFPKLYATYANVVVSQESTEDARRPSRVVLTGKLPQGR